MAGKEKYTAQEMAEALIATKGMTTLAARRLGCDWKTVKRYIDKYPTVAAACNEANEVTGDMVELKLLEKIQQGDTASIIFALKTKYRARGYTEKIDVDISIPQLQEFIAAIRATGQQPDVFMQRVIERARLEQNVH